MTLNPEQVILSQEELLTKIIQTTAWTDAMPNTRTGDISHNK